MTATTKNIGWTGDTLPDSSGFEKPSREQYNLNHGRVASAPTVGGDSHGNRSPKGMPPNAPKSKRIKPID